MTAINQPQGPGVFVRDRHLYGIIKSEEGGVKLGHQLPIGQMEMEIITTTLVVTNRIDQVLAAQGIITPSKVRRITLLDVLVNIGATTLCLPEDTIASLGLEYLKEVYVETGSGIAKLRVFQDAKISLLSREGTFECVELPSGSYPLLGVIPLEALGIKLDLNNQKLEPLPISSTETYLTIL